MSLPTWTGPTLASEFLGLLVDGTLKASVLLGGALFAERLVRRAPAAVRHSVLWAGLLAVPVVILGGALLRSSPIWLDAVSEPLSLVLVFAYLLGVSIIALPLVRGGVALAKLTARAEHDAPWLGSLQAGRKTRLLIAEISVPMTFGWLRPVVLFPSSAERWSEDERHSALAHEVAHIRRGDWLVLLASHLVVAVAWFHPLAWMVRRRMLLLAEHAADDQVLRSGVQPSAYARHLLDRCSELGSLRPAAMTMAPVHPRQLEARVRAILAPDQARAASPASSRLTAVALFLAVVPLAAASVVPVPLPPEPTCQVVADAAGRPGPWAPEELADPDAPSLDFELLKTYSGAMPALAYLTEEVGRLSPQELSTRQEAASFIVRNCPYRRGGLQLLATIRMELQRFDPALQPVPPDGAAELIARIDRLRALVDRHWAYMEALGIDDLPAPREGDFMSQPAAKPTLQTGQSLRSAWEPVDLTEKTVRSVRDLVAHIDDVTGDALNAAEAQMGSEDGNLLLMPVFRVYTRELAAIDQLATEARVGAAADERGVRPELPTYCEEVELSTLRLSILSRMYNGMGC